MVSIICSKLVLGLKSEEDSVISGNIVSVVVSIPAVAASGDKADVPEEVETAGIIAVGDVVSNALGYKRGRSPRRPKAFDTIRLSLVLGPDIVHWCLALLCAALQESITGQRTCKQKGLHVLERLKIAICAFSA